MTLDARDRALLEAAEVYTHDPVDWDEAARRLRKVLERFPDDLEGLAALAEALIDAGTSSPWLPKALPAP